MRLQHESFRFDVQQRIPRRAFCKSRQEIEGQGFEIKRQRCGELVALRIEFIRLPKGFVPELPVGLTRPDSVPDRIPISQRTLNFCHAFMAGGNCSSSLRLSCSGRAKMPTAFRPATMRKQTFGRWGILWAELADLPPAVAARYSLRDRG